MLGVFFVFKQKTAYEMRISDWSSDVCSSDLVGINLNATAPFAGPFLAQFLQGGLDINPDTLAKFYALHMLLVPAGIMALIGLHLYLVVQIGRASCRERVCQYV